ncbi:MAG TPA: MarR family transcriptional regulator [Gaiellaceae bacterium]|nr:MarR family transcriptional regulator [Gaiellaceae bacterium]
MAPPEIPPPYLDAWRTFLDAHAAATERIEQQLAAAGLPPLSWYDALWPLHRAPGRRLRMGALASEVVTISRTGLTRLVDRLEAAGLVRREPSSEDRRGTVVTITREGSALLRRMWPVYAEEIRRCFAEPLREEQAAALHAALSQVRAAARGGPAPARKRRPRPRVVS